MHALDPIHVGPEKLARWLDVAHGFAAMRNVLVIELTDFAPDPVRHRLRRAADAARDLVGRLRGRHKAVAEALATELEIAPTHDAFCAEPSSESCPSLPHHRGRCQLSSLPQ